MHTIKITPNFLFEYQCTSGKFIRLPNQIEKNRFGSENRIESNRNFFCPNWNALLHTNTTTLRHFFTLWLSIQLFPHFPPMQIGPAFSCPAISTCANWCRKFMSRIFANVWLHVVVNVICVHASIATRVTSSRPWVFPAMTEQLY